MFQSRALGALAALAFMLCPQACVVDLEDQTELGTVTLGLHTEAGGVTYRLTNARFALSGPETRGFASGDEASLRLELTPGVYSLELLEGWSLVRADAPEAGGLEAKLVSENPAPLLVEAGVTTHMALRFELSDGSLVGSGKGTLQVDLELGNGPLETGVEDGACVSGLRINELDYDQAGVDEAEFVEIINTASCDAALDGVVLELVNGGDGKVYARYALSTAGATLASGDRLVLGDAAVLSTLPSDVLALPLNGAGLQNGPDGVRLLSGTQLLDAVAYEGAVSQAGEGDPTPTDPGDGALGRCPDAFDSDQNALDFRLLAPTPGLPNACS